MTSTILANGGSAMNVRQAGAAQLEKVGGSFNVLRMGDLIYLERSQDENGSGGGVVHGDTNLRQVGVVAPRLGAKEAGAGSLGSWRFNDCVFRLCSKLNYFAKCELEHLEGEREKREHAKEEALDDAGKASTASVVREDSRFMADLKLARERAEVEKKQNHHTLEAIDAGIAESVKYGDIVQLQHLSSGFFITVHHTSAPVDFHCRKVSLEPEGSFLSKFQILPRYRSQSMGSSVTAGAGIVLQNVEFSSITLGVGCGPNTERPPAVYLRAQPQPAKCMRLPYVLDHEPIVEVNGSLEQRGGFTVRLFNHRSVTAAAGGGVQETAHRDSLHTSLHKFRLFHPEREAALCASANTDKGEVLDYANDFEGQIKPTQVREGGVPAHVPYAKLALANNGSNGSVGSTVADLKGQGGGIKGVWCFEHVDRNMSSAVTWRSPLRIRHVSSGKYLSVNSKTKTAAPVTIVSAGTSSVGVKPAYEVTEATQFFDVALVVDEDLSAEPGAFGSAESLVFHIVPQDAQLQPTVPSGITAISIEHHPPWGNATCPLFLFVPGEPKLQMTWKPKEKLSAGLSLGPSNNPLSSGLRILFSTHKSPDDALRIYPVGPKKSMQLDQIVSKIPALKLYTYMYQSEPAMSKCVDLAEPVCACVLRLLGALRKKHEGESWSPLLTSKSTLEFMKAANSNQFRDLASSFTGEQDSSVQVMVVQTKLLDCIFEASLAPYNKGFLAGRPFDERLASDLPRALQTVLNITLQCVSRGNKRAQKYFSKSSSRAWFTDISVTTNTTKQATKQATKMSKSRWRELGLAVRNIAKTTRFLPRRLEPWYDLMVLMSQDELGSADVLMDLIRSSDTFSAKVYSCDFIRLIKSIIGRFGPQRRLIDILSALCYINGAPSVSRQEQCVRQIIADPYSYGLSFHSLPDAASHESVNKFGPRSRVPLFDLGWAAEEGFEASFVHGKLRFLGDTEANSYAPVCVAWSSDSGNDWESGCGKLWWSPVGLNLPVVDTIDVDEKRDNEYAQREGVAGTVASLGLVPLEYIMWPLDPEALCLIVLGEPFEPEKYGFGSSKNAKKRKEKAPTRRRRKSNFNIKQDSNILYTATQGVLKTREQFVALFTLAEYMVAQIDFLATVCANRSSLCQDHVKKMFSYDLLINMATNERLPCTFRSSVLQLLNAVYVDRYPQLPASGAPHFPEALWVFAEEDYSGPRKSTTPIIRKISLTQEGAFPMFAVSPLSLVNQAPRAQMDHHKFYLLSSKCESLVDLAVSSGIVHSSSRSNSLALSALQSEAKLLDFGFMGSLAKLRRVAHTCALVLDGRRDLMLPGVPFESLEARYHQGAASKVPNDMKKCAMEILLHIVDVRANFRLAKLLNLFKDKATAHALHTNSHTAVIELDKFSLRPREGKGRRQDSANNHAAQLYLMGARHQELFEDFDALFTTDQAADLDLAKLANMKNLDHVIMDCLMYDCDEIVETGLRLLFSTYDQRRQLRKSLEDVVLLPSPMLPVFGDVHMLRTETNDLFSLLQTYSVWGVKSVIAGPFGDVEFGETMLTVERLLLFLHDFDIFKSRIRMQPYSILGTRMGLDKKIVDGAGADPGDVPECAIVDPAGLKYIQPFGGGPGRVSGASKSIHKWIGTDKDTSFHPDIMQAIKNPGQAKYHMYHRPDGKSNAHVIHAVGPDFRRKHEPGMPPYTRDEGIELLCQAYHSILMEFVKSGQNVLRLTPVSGGAQAGPFASEIAPLAEAGMRGGFARLTASQQAHVLEKELHLCVFAEKELKLFYEAGFIPSSEAAKLLGLSEGTEGGVDSSAGLAVAGAQHGAATSDIMHKKKVKNPEYYQDSFQCKGMDGERYASTELWSLNVAEKWANTFDRLPVMGKFQDILRAFNVQRIIVDTLLGQGRMDPKIGWKGSVCTGAEKVESERRLTLVHSALLTLAIKFVTDNRENQRIVASVFEELQDLAAGVISADDRMHNGSSGSSGRGGGGRKMKFDLSLVSEVRASANGNSIPELAQELILAVLRGNEPLVESYVGPSLINLFVRLANFSEDVSTSRAIDFFFVLVKPEAQPLKKQQTAIVRAMLGSGRFSPLVNGLRRCLREVTGEIQTPSDNNSKNEEDNVKKSVNKRRSSTVDLHVPLENPVRLVHLAFALVQGGNGDAWLELATHAEVTLDDACVATVKFLKKFMSKAGYAGPTLPPPPPDPTEESKAAEASGGSHASLERTDSSLDSPPLWDAAQAAVKDAEVKSAAVSQLLESGTGKVLCDLLVEAVIIVPHTKVTLRSPSLWMFMEEAAEPVISRFVTQEYPSAAEISLVTVMIEAVQHVLSELVIAGLLEDVLIDHARTIASLGTACDVILEGRTDFYDELRAKFTETIELRGRGPSSNLTPVAEGTLSPLSIETPTRMKVARASSTVALGGSAWNLGSFLGPDLQRKDQVIGELNREEFKALMIILGQYGNFTDDDNSQKEVGKRSSSGRSFARNKNSILKRGALPGVNHFDFGEAFDVADLDGDGSVNLEEFISLFELVVQGALSFGGARVHLYHRISKRSMECIERINLICAKNYASLKDLKQPRAMDSEPSPSSSLEGKKVKGGGSGAAEPYLKGSRRKNSAGKRGWVNNYNKGESFLKAKKLLEEESSGGTVLRANLEDQFSAFQAAVKNNPMIKNKLEERQLLMVSVLEKGVPLLDAAGKPVGVAEQTPAAVVAASRTLRPGATPPRPGSREAKKLMVAASLQIRWEDLTARLVKYVRDHFRDEGSGAQTCLLIFQVWTLHLLKSQDDAKKLSAHLGSGPSVKQVKKLARAKQAYEDKQESLDDSGVTELLTKIIIKLPAADVGSVQDKAIDLFSELLKGGNVQLQRSLFAYIDKNDNSEGKFLAHLFERLDHGFVGLQGCKQRGLFGANMTPECEEYADNIAQSLEFLQLLCEGHNAEFQNFLREQPKCPVQVNLIQKVIDFLVLIVDSSVTVADFSRSERHLVAQIIAFLTETMQGPCSRNQVYITTVEVINAVNAIIMTTSSSQTQNMVATRVTALNNGTAVGGGAGVNGGDGEEDDHDDLRASACEMLAACLEGRHDSLTHDTMKRRIEQRALGQYRSELETEIRAMLTAANAEFRLLGEDEEAELATKQRALAAIATVALELQLALPNESMNDATEAAATALAATTEMSTKKAAAAATKFVSENTQDEILEAHLGERGRWGGSKKEYQHATNKKEMEMPHRPSLDYRAEQALLLGDDDNDEDEDDDYYSEDHGGSSSSSDDEDGARSGGAGGGGGGGAGGGAGGGKIGGEGGIGSGLLGTCEIAWQGKIERTVFPMPIECKYLTKKTKSDFMNEVQLDTADTRMTELVKQLAVFEAEMKLVHERSVESRVYQFLTNYLSALKSLMYLLVVLLNLNVLMSPATLSSPSEALGRHYGWIDSEDDVIRERNNSGLNDLELYSLLLTLVLGVVNFIGYFVIMFHVGRTEVPILIKEYEETLRQNRIALTPDKWINFKPFKPWFATLFFNIMFCILHSANFTPIPLLYVCTFCFINLPWTLLCIRKSVLVPSGNSRQLQWWYCVAYETVVSRPIFRNHVILQCFNLLGFYRSEWFTLMLLDVLNINPTLAGIIKSVTAPGFSLMMVFYLFVVTIVIYASFGQSWFQRYLVVPGFDEATGEESDGVECSSTLSCFYFLFYTQLAGPLGELREHMRVVDPHSGDYLQRIVYDSVFFIWVGLVLANIITGLMVDTFSAIREVEAERKEVFETQCFVCGLTRAVYEDMSLGKKYATFKQHKTQEHNPWIYVAYLVYLRQKEETDYNGIEAYVVSSVEKRSTDWIPNGTSAAIEAHRKEVAARAARSALTLDAHDAAANHDNSNNTASGIPGPPPGPGSGAGGSGGGGNGGGVAPVDGGSKSNSANRGAVLTRTDSMISLGGGDMRMSPPPGINEDGSIPFPVSPLAAAAVSTMSESASSSQARMESLLTYAVAQIKEQGYKLAALQADVNEMNRQRASPTEQGVSLPSFVPVAPAPGTVLAGGSVRPSASKKTGIWVDGTY